MDQKTLETLLVAQVLTLAVALETRSKVQDKKESTIWIREAAKLINQKQSEVLQLLAETRSHQ
jgi:hypothetical protein